MLTSKKIYIKKHVNYYDESKKLINTAEVEKKEVESLEIAKELVKNYKLQCITNKKGISASEEIGYIWTGPDGIIYREKKTINPFTRKEF